MEFKFFVLYLNFEKPKSAVNIVLTTFTALHITS
ncbi:hypothetical protein LM5923_1328 [Listeria monocytogenes 08-5923]|nr:hypothetical protein LM5578_1375 [Listeria monocytogenes 08-5578]ADB71170.1 hypothetical protein LM5923_1328 [Listeria monocytogenes 08-5923]ASG96822.1 hypothetical protein N883_1348 [Listeria monocytogenes serotype 1/2a str. 01-5252]ASH84412.1 hypothetical protein N882_1336 [Listeria monocytogenes serotype 1/2a str. 01-1468]